MSASSTQGSSLEGDGGTPASDPPAGGQASSASGGGSQKDNAGSAAHGTSDGGGTLPQTASPLPSLALAGAVSLVMGAGVVMSRKF